MTNINREISETAATLRRNSISAVEDLAAQAKDTMATATEKAKEVAEVAATEVQRKAEWAKEAVADGVAQATFLAHRPSGKAETLPVVLQRIGRAEDLNAKVRESLGTLLRMVVYLATTAEQAGGPALGTGEKATAQVLLEDIRSLREVAGAQSEKVRFLLDATLGVINIRQSDVIKIFSVVAFVFLPPTLIASIYGMNFKYMPELEWSWGYPMAVGLMVLSALVPYFLFRWKKWL